MADLSITAANVKSGANAATETGTAGAGVTAGQAVFKSSTTGKYLLSDANGSGTRQVRGIALHAAAADQPLMIQRSGEIVIGGTLTAGADYWLSGTAGALCPKSDLTTGDDPILVGVAKSTTVLQLAIVDVDVTL